ncbi:MULTISPECIES: glycosyltransferase family 4 protein [Halorussus]|uniref:glycosyltransferase family 4 protein n=1 Tax=Halorussus TaxID=1070314 RepID=UPI00209C8D53|nr:glycosyltransferase family 4 protein [Halorussus vallis]USZ77308.1 glycosyltransferase family 4 protein [Halorussus vallis]
MARIAVAHTDLMAKGGGEGVCMNVLEALQEDHEVTLLTLTPPDLTELNDYFRTDVRDVAVDRPPLVDDFLAWLDNPRYNLRNALLNRYVSARRDDFDLAFGTDNELSVAGPLVQYVHTPRFARLVVSKRVGEDSFADHAYDRLCWRLGEFDPEEIRGSALLSNSEWMADVVQDAYDARPRVVHPPVDTRGFGERERPFEEREDGFVTVGRIAGYKNVLEDIEIIDRVRDRGHDVHLHLVGPAYDDEYTRKVKQAATERDYVSVEGELPREEVVETICRHKYGLHGKRHEHFGMAVAELVAGGTVPFVPDNGGQREIVGSDELTYSTVEEAVESVDRVLSDSERARELRSESAEIERRFGRERFQSEVREVVAEALA